jgi:hypothetical protein
MTGWVAHGRFLELLTRVILWVWACMESIAGGRGQRAMLIFAIQLSRDGRDIRMISIR